MSPLDLQAIVDEHLVQCGPCDFGLVEYACNCPKSDPRLAIQRLVDEVKRLRPVVEAAQAWRERIVDPPSLWADDEDFAVIGAVDAYKNEAPDAS